MTEPTAKTPADYTEGSIFASIVKMGLPSMFGFLVSHVYSMVDMYWVSRLPEQESGVAAITFFANILWFFFSFNQLVGPGSVAIISRRYGEKEYDRAEKAIKETIILKLFFGVIFGVAGYFFSAQMLHAIGARGEALALGVEYGRVMFLGMPIMYATYSIFTGMRGVANPNLAMVLMLGSNLLNIVLDPIFIFGYFGLPGWGILGAAYASVFAYCLTFAIGLYLFYSNRTNIPFHFRGKEPLSIASMVQIVKIGVPAWLGSISYSGARLFITRLVAPFGTAVVAAYGIGNQITAFGVMILVGIGLGLSSLIGHNLGANKTQRARQTADQAVLLGVGVMLFMGIVAYFFARQIMGIFFDAEETVRIGAVMLRIFAVGFPFIGAFIMLEEIHLGVGLNTPTMVLNIINSWILEVIPIYLLTVVLTYNQLAIWWTITLASMVSALMFYFYYRRGRWLTVRV